LKYSGSVLCCATFAGLLSMTVLSAIGPSIGNRVLAQTPQSAPAPKSKPGEVVSLPDAPGKEIAARVCSKCHSPNVWAKQRHTPDEWGAIVERMVNRGAEATNDEFAEIMQYLSTNLAPADPPAPAAPPPSR
jgi:competence protein ComEA